MRRARIKEECSACYHVMSRVVDRRMILNHGEKEKLRELMRRMEGFSGLRILTWTILSNHFHILLQVPERQYVTDDEFIRRLGFLYDKAVVKTHAGELERLREAGQDRDAEAYKARFTYRMYDLSEYMKTVKQRFSQSYNRRHGRKGTLWEERFKSLLVQPPRSSSSSMSAIAAVAGYIDLNCVRAGIVEDPKDYRFCGYAEAVAGKGVAREGIAWVLGCMCDGNGWQAAARQYRQFLYISGESRGTDEAGRPKPGFSPERVRQVLEEGGRLTVAEVLHCRVRYFSDGVILGARDYVDEAFARHREFFSRGRISGARRMGGAQWGDMCTARKLRLDVVTIPATG